MSRVSNRAFIAVGIGFTIVGAGVLACSSSTSGGGGGGGSTACTEPNALTIEFSPMYSAYDGTHMFQIPAIVTGLSGATWSVSDPTAASLAADTETGGTMITITKGGVNTVTVNAQVGDLCGSATLNITQNAATDWQIGNARYNDGNAIHFGPPGSGDAGMTTTPDAGPACTQCHGPTADAGFKDIAHTPQQTGGFSDQDLINIVVNGEVPGWNDDGTSSADAGYFDPSIIPYQEWHHLHQWSDITTDEQAGIVVYLRSLTPTAQTGSADFGGHGGGDGGHYGGMGGPPGSGSGSGPGGGGGGGDAGSTDN